MAWADAAMAARDVRVIGVSQAIVDRVGSARSAVVPNGVCAADHEATAPYPVLVRRTRRSGGAVRREPPGTHRRGGPRPVCAGPPRLEHRAGRRAAGSVPVRPAVATPQRPPPGARAPPGRPRHDGRGHGLPGPPPQDPDVGGDEPAEALRVPRVGCAGGRLGPRADARRLGPVPADRAGSPPGSRGAGGGSPPPASAALSSPGSGARTTGPRATATGAPQPGADRSGALPEPARSRDGGAARSSRRAAGCARAARSRPRR